MITQYFATVRQALQEYSHIISSYTSEEKVYSDEKGYVQYTVVFIDRSVLEFAEVKFTDHESKVKYRYHFMDEQSSLIFRYDNAKHHPDVSTFPHHKHLSKGVIKSSEPSIQTVLKEVEECIVDKLR